MYVHLSLHLLYLNSDGDINVLEYIYTAVKFVTW